MFAFDTSQQKLLDVPVRLVNITLSGMFHRATSFEYSLSRWKVERVQDISWMLTASQLNSLISHWQVSLATCIPLPMHGSLTSFSTNGMHPTWYRCTVSLKGPSQCNMVPNVLISGTARQISSQTVYEMNSQIKNREIRGRFLNLIWLKSKGCPVMQLGSVCTSNKVRSSRWNTS